MPSFYIAAVRHCEGAEVRLDMLSSALFLLSLFLRGWRLAYPAQIV